MYLFRRTFSFFHARAGSAERLASALPRQQWLLTDSVRRMVNKYAVIEIDGITAAETTQFYG